MNDKINAVLAVARQQFDELMTLRSLDDLRSLNLGDGAKRQRVAVLLEAINRAAGTIDRELRGVSDVQIVQAGASHITFFREKFEPNMQVLRRAYWASTGDLELYDDIEGYEPPYPSTRVSETISWGLQRWFDPLDEEELDDWSERGFEIETALQTVQERWFEPDRWLENRQLLRPVLMDKPVQNIRDHVRHRLSEIYRTFQFGLYMSSIALCRSLLEYSLKETAQKFGVEKSKVGYRGQPEDKSMKELCDSFSEKLPALREELDRVRDAGNRVMHAQKRDLIAFPKVLRSEALGCIGSLRNSLETMYGNSLVS